jgi:hypothetical protein
METIKEYSDTADKWFNETISNAGTRPVLDEFLVAILVVAKKYSEACFTLLENNHILPAKAILRILAELFVKLAWCIDIENKNSKDAERTDKLKRWAYYTEKEKLKGLERCLMATADKSEIEFIQQGIQKKQDYLKRFPQSIVENEFPSTFDLFTKEKIGGFDSSTGHYFYLKNYFLYNNAVHLDMCSIGNLVKRQNGIKFIVLDASDDKAKLVKNCLYQAMLIIVLVRKYYKQKIEKVINEYDNIVKIH